ncbi:hypothetical protein B0A48_06424 [Cryoendolithus antarcticus]|uniref:amidase n=1 Tax=Cryoendolithus antarcticus TaxID=1507870 RepID=A0A1V8TB97_9PEZI|nr:hypothetical protein B0A48_06424 [Cryoendolithus antarcticus]
MAKPWQDIARTKQQARLAAIPPHWILDGSIKPGPSVQDVQDFPRASGFFTTEELSITEATASEVVANIAHRKWTAVEVIKAVSKRAAVAQQLVNCLTEIYFEQALKRAEELDAYQVREDRTVGPLHGLPISFKDQFNLKGVDSTIGYISYVGKPATEDSTLVTLLVKAGAIPYVKTNVPATLMMGETVNNLFGRTVNPRNRKLTSGGSSGGESALVSFCGSYIGVGTDIGGSIRDPCNFTGLFGLRPSQGRVSYQHVVNTYVGQDAVKSAAGPMCRSPADIRLFMSTLAAQKPWLHDPACLPIPWRTEEEKVPTELCFGIAVGDGYVNSSPPLRRAIAITRSKLEAAGHKVIDFVPHEGVEALDIVQKMWSADGGAEFQRDTDASGEPLHPHLESWAGHSANVKPQTVEEMWANQQRRNVLARKWLDHWQGTVAETGNGRPIDGLIMPSTPFPAIRHDVRYSWHYGHLAPLLDLTTGVFPVTKVDVEKDQIPDDWQPLSDKDRELMEYYEKPENHVNSPVGLALYGRRLEEEKVTAMLQVIHEVVGVDY